MEIDVAFLEGRRLLDRHEEVAILPELGLIAIRDARQLDQESALKRPDFHDFDGIALHLPSSVAHKKTTAGREDLVRLVGLRLDHQLTLQAVHIAHAPDDDVLGQASAAFSETGTALAVSLRPRRCSWRALRTPARRSSE